MPNPKSKIEMWLPSFAKINWTLDVLGLRPDGYHELRTLYQTVGLADRLHIELLDEPGVDVVSDGLGVPSGPSNLAHRAAAAFLETAGLARSVGVRVRIAKDIPAGGGLGGGSSNAATTLIALERLTRTRLPDRVRFEIARDIGADVPLFLLGGTVLGVGRGDEVYALADAPASHLVVANPGVVVETARVFAAFSARLTRPAPLAMMPFTFHAALRIRESPIKVGNDLEDAVVGDHPEVGAARAALVGVGATRAWMTGSGASVVGIFESAGAAVSAVDDLAEQGIWARAVETLDRVAYRQALGLPL
jgi:4-diphosphocytidyl-2-C-methyl-D-erythritol kinase